MSEEETRDIMNLYNALKEFDDVNDDVVDRFVELTIYFNSREADAKLTIQDVADETGISLSMIRMFLKFLRHVKKLTKSKLEENEGSTQGALEWVIEDEEV